MAIMDILGLLAVVGILAYWRASLWIWSVVIGLTLLLLTTYSRVSIFVFLPCWILFIISVLFVTCKKYRLLYFTRPLMKNLQKHMPAISKTEQEAIEAGDVWWEKDLFGGQPQWKKLLAIPAPRLTPEEEAFIDNQVESLCGMLDDWHIINEAHDLPPQVWDYLKQQKFFGMIIPKEYGGLGFSALAHSTVIIKIATRSISAAVNTMVPNSLGPAELLVHYGTKEQKEYYLPRLAKGEEIPCFALTGPEAGSDAGSITDKGIVCRGEYQGQDVLGIRLTWDKRYITLAPIATVLGLAFRLYDPDHLLGTVDNIGITVCLVPTSHPGVEIGHRHLPLYLAFMNGPTRGTDVFIPIDWIIGGVPMAGQGWRMLMECLSIGRSISLPALSAASGKLVYRMTGAYAALRRQFNTPIARFEGVEEALAEIAGFTYLLEACRQMTAGAVDQQINPSTVSAIAKYHMTEIARKIVNHAMDIHAGSMIQAGPRNFLANVHLAIPICITVEGANILTRNLIIFGQGAIRCHPYVLQEVELLGGNDPEKDKKFDCILLSHLGYVISNVVRNWWCGLTGGKLLFSPRSGPTARYYRQLTRMSTALALLADVSMLLLGGSLKRKERISARLGDILSELYLASTVLKYFQDQGAPATDLPYVQWCIERCLYQIQTACNELLHNFPQRGLGKMLHWLIFPWGAAYHKPRDELGQKIVNTMLVPSALRDRITAHCYTSSDADDAMQHLEKAFALHAEIEPLLKKFQSILRESNLETALKTGVVTADEIETFQHFRALHQEIIKVNEFSFDLTKVIS
jgi:acyl-CoA dehydrogenase